jgi:glutamine cyclotransferase
MMAVLIAAVAAAAAYYFLVTRSYSPLPSTTSIPVYTFGVVRAFNHDPDAFTQGLAFDGGTFYEGTGLRGESTLRQVDPETGEVIRLHRLPDEFFGEGITLHGDRIIQLTYTSNIGFVYNKADFELIGEFTYPTEGWGITSDGSRLIMSDGTSTLYILDAETFEPTGRIEVTAEGKPVRGLNELEYIEGEIYANLWPTDSIARISIETGEVTAWIRLSGLIGPQDVSDPTHMPNGIAYDAERERLFVTGKCWPRLFEIKLIPLKQE